MRRLRELLRNGVSDVQYYMNLNKGGKGGSAPVAQQPYVNPTPPVEEASVDLEEDDMDKKKRTSKASLKIPLTTASDTGLKV